MDTKIVNIPTKIFEKIEKRVEITDFQNVDEYVAYVLDQVLEQLEDEGQDSSYSEEDEKKVKERLKSLGYLD